MKKSILFTGLILAATINAQDTIRIMTYNIEAGVQANMEEIGQYIKAQKPDVVALQEIDQWAYRAKRKSPSPENQVVKLATEADMLPVFSQTCDFNSGFYGIGLLSKYNIISYKRILLPQSNPEYEPRVALVVELDVNGKKITIVNTHLTLVDEDRLLQAKFIAKQLRKIKTPKLLCGDMNTQPDEIIMTKTWTKYHDALPENQTTFPSVKPRAKLDYIFTDSKDNIEIVNQHVDTSCGLSDHCPCYVDIIIK